VDFVPFLHICVLLFCDLVVFRVLLCFKLYWKRTLLSLPIEPRDKPFLPNHVDCTYCIFQQQNTDVKKKKASLIFLINFFIEGLMHVHYRICSSPLKIDGRKHFFVPS